MRLNTSAGYRLASGPPAPDHGCNDCCQPGRDAAGAATPLATKEQVPWDSQDVTS